MALFKSQEQKEFELLQKYGLENVTDPYVLQVLKEMSNDLRGSKMMQVGLQMQGSKEGMKMAMQKTLISQNFIIIRQLDELTKLLEK